MIERENILTKLELLAEQGTLAMSACSKALLASLRPLIEGGVVVWERAGAGRRLAVRDLPAFQAFKQSQFPNVCLAGLGTRVEGVARFRDSKTFAGDTPEMISVRVWDEAALTSQGASVGAASATSRFGVFSFLLEEPRNYGLHGACALVENPAVFLSFERLGLAVGLVMYGRGRISTAALDWLKRAGEDAVLLHLPDYDPVGLSEHVRLREVLGERVRLYLPADLEARFERFANRRLLQKANNQALLAGLRACPVNEVRKVVGLIDKHNSVLEQEALLVEQGANSKMEMSGPAAANRDRPAFG